MSSEYPTEAFIKRSMGVIEAARVLADALRQQGEVRVDWVAEDNCPIPLGPPAGRVIPPNHVLCGATVGVMLRVEDSSQPTHDLVILDEDGVRAVLAVLSTCSHRPVVKELYQAACDRLEASS